MRWFSSKSFDLRDQVFARTAAIEPPVAAKRYEIVSPLMDDTKDRAAASGAQAMRTLDGGIVVLATMFEAFVVAVGKIGGKHGDLSQQRKNIRAQIKGANAEIASDVIEKLTYAVEMFGAFLALVASIDKLDEKANFVRIMAREIEVLLNLDEAYFKAKSFEVWVRHRESIFRSLPAFAQVLAHFYNTAHNRMARIENLKKSVFVGYHNFLERLAQYAKSNNADDLDAARFVLQTVFRDLASMGECYAAILALGEECFAKD